jgi:hypothetical protein
MNYRTLVHELSRDQPKTTKELLDITTRHASSEEAVGAIFIQSSEKAAPGGCWVVLTTAADKGTKWGIKNDKRRPKRQPQRVTVSTSCDEGNNNKNASNSDEELMATAERDFKCQVWQSVDHFMKLLKATYPNHMYPVKHKLKDYTMMKNYMTTRFFARSKKLEGDSAGKGANPFPEDKAVMSIYGGPPSKPQATSSLAKQSISSAWRS